MTLIKSISGIRGTIGGKPGENLTPIDIVKYAAAYGEIIKKGSEQAVVVIGRDARPSGNLLSDLVASTLCALGCDVVDLGLSTTPTVEMAVICLAASGGIILTASHNPEEWNALKLLDKRGEFISDVIGKEVIAKAQLENFAFSPVHSLGRISYVNDFLKRHIQKVCDYPLVDVEAISLARFKVAVDGVNSTGGICVPDLLEALGVTQIEKIHCEPSGHFAHNPEPLPAHLTDLSQLVQTSKCDLGIVVDPDVDRLAFVCENGEMFGEEYTLVAVADYMLSQKTGAAVSNLSSTRALHDVAIAHGGTYHAAAVGEVNVVAKMKETDAVIGGEGNGGVIVPDFHYGRDALIGIGLFLTYLAKSKKRMSELKEALPQYEMSKNKVELIKGMDVELILDQVAAKYADEKVNRVDGVKIDFQKGWVHLRKSNTEPIIRVYAEGIDSKVANAYAEEVMHCIKGMIS